jgi:glycerol-3-phosphate acyltransferase PlsY
LFAYFCAVGVFLCGAKLIYNLILEIFGIYIIGAIPTAFLVYKIKSGGDLRKLGGGNIGAMNAYESSGSILLGFLVFLIDFLKGLLCAFLSINVFTFQYPEFVIPFVIIGHNYSVFLKFKGGRGLASALGVSALINPIPAILWCLGWVIAKKAAKDIHIANNFASNVSLIAFPLLPYHIIERMNIISQWHKAQLVVCFSIISILLILAHIKPVIKILEQRRLAK